MSDTTNEVPKSTDVPTARYGVDLTETNYPGTYASIKSVKLGGKKRRKTLRRKTSRKRRNSKRKRRKSKRRRRKSQRGG